ncbi:MAG: DegV family protein [Candidatus Limnocylindrales bacterium]
MSVAVVTDSGSDLTPEELREFDIRQVPLSVSFGEESYLSPDELGPDAFWEKMCAPDSPFAHTAAASIGLFKQAFEQAFADGHESVVCVCLSGGLSATIKHAQMAKEMLATKQIFILDSKTATMGIGALALRGARLAAAGASGAEIHSKLTAMRDREDLYCALDTLEYLRKGGRIGNTKAAIGGLLSIKPILTVDEGVVIVTDQPRTRSKAIERVIELVSDRPATEIHVLYSPPADSAAFRELVLAHMPEPAPKVVTTHIIGPVIGAHVGPGALGAIMVRED